MTNIIKRLGAFVVESKKGGSDSGASRSALLRMVMPHLSGKAGDNLAKLYEAGNVEAFANAWAKVTENILQKVDKGDKRVVKASFDNLSDYRKQLVKIKRQRVMNKRKGGIT